MKDSEMIEDLHETMNDKLKMYFRSLFIDLNVIFPGVKIVNNIQTTDSTMLVCEYDENMCYCDSYFVDYRDIQTNIEQILKFNDCPNESIKILDWLIQKFDIVIDDQILDCCDIKLTDSDCVKDETFFDKYDNEIEAVDFYNKYKNQFKGKDVSLFIKSIQDKSVYLVSYFEKILKQDISFLTKHSLIELNDEQFIIEF